jgi:UDP-N-acetylmuramoylalanine--D-glutamate ligase
MKIGLVGWGVETQSAFRYYGAEHAYVIGNEEPRDDFPFGDNIEVYALTEKRLPGLVGNVSDLSYLDHYDDCDLVIFQGATRKNLEKKFDIGHPFWEKAKTTLDIFFEECPSKNTIGVTGTKGKGTTTTLIHRLIDAAHLPTVIGGNIGIPVLELLPHITPETWVVLELSNFQLYKFSHSPHIGVHLMMMHEHIEEWHKTMADYVQAKRNIFSHQSKDDIAVYLASNQYSSANAEYSTGKKIPFFEPPGARVEDGLIVIENTAVIDTKEVGLIGAHNLQNICAAITTVWNIHQNIGVYREVLANFTGLEHRLELAGEVSGVRYYDDSFGTTPDTAIVAMDAFTVPKVVIVGGHDKGNDMRPVCDRLSEEDIRHVVFIGTIGQAMYEDAIRHGLSPEKATIREDGNSWTMDEIVSEATHYAKKGDVVLLSTGSSSFGLFKDYKDRGNQFKQSVASVARLGQQ